MNGGPDTSSPWARASLAAAIFAVDPSASGVLLRAGLSPARDAWLAMLKSLLPAGAPMRRVPLTIDDHGLLGGLDLSATLSSSRPVVATGVIARADGGVLMLATAERLSVETAARVAAAIDNGGVCAERDGFALRVRARFGVIALDEGDGWEERPPETLADRLGLHIDLNDVSYRDLADCPHDARQIKAARERLASVRASEDAIEALVTVASQLGIGSLRAPLLALNVARALCALRGSAVLDEQDLATGAQLVLAPRAVVLPVEEPRSNQPDSSSLDEDDSDSPWQRSDSEDAYSLQDAKPQALNEVILAAARAAIPRGLLEHGTTAAKKSREAERGGAKAKSVSLRRGRPIAARAGKLREGRLGIIDTLRAAALRQSLRRNAGALVDARRLIVRSEDFRVIRFRARRHTTAIFVVDASGSTAVQRLAEVKGAIELLLSECYSRRDSVAMIAFRGNSAEIILPPTRSLTRAKRMLASLPGGGGTPLAAGLDAAVILASAIRRKGCSPLLVLMTDGRANIGRDGQPGRRRAFQDALNAGQSARVAGLAAIAIDTSPRAQKRTEPPTLQIGRAMNAHYIELPDADAARVTEVVRGAAVAA
jgi:magnesium chelatase subunit D